MRPLVLLALTSLPAVAAAVTVDPELVTGTLEPGESLDVDLVVDLSATTSETGDSDSEGTDVGYSGGETGEVSPPPLVLPTGSTVTASVVSGCPLDISFAPSEHTGVFSGETVSFAETVAVPADITEGELDEGYASCTVEVQRDGAVVGTQSVLIEVPLDLPPVAVCVDVVVDADPATCLADADVDGGSFDPDGGDVTTAVSPAGPFGVGTHVVTMTVTDADGGTDSCEALVTVEDSTAPIVEVGEMPLWPPNHKMLELDLGECGVTVSDSCGGTSSVGDVGTITAVWSDEPEDERGGGDGHTLGDVAILGPTSFAVRAERRGSGNGRVYGVAFVVADDAGNVTEAVCHIGVPHAQDGTEPVDDGASSGYPIVR